MDLKNPRQNPANFSHNHDCANLSTQKNVNKKKWLRIFGAGGLAFFMGVGTLCGVLLAPMNSAQASVGGRGTNSTTSPLGLDPENDPVVYKSADGLEIKYSNNKLNSGPLSGYAYITMGNYNGYDINWVIIGKSTTFASNAYNSWAYFHKIDSATWNGITSNPAAFATYSDSPKGLVYTDFALSNAISKDEIPAGCVLAISEYVLTTTSWHSTTLNVNFANSYIKPKLADLYSSTLGLDEVEQKRLQSAPVCGSDLYFFLMNISYGNTSTSYFTVQQYLTTNELRIAYKLDTPTTASSYWSSCIGGGSNYGQPNIINASGAPAMVNSKYVSSGIRPACLINIQ